MFRKKDLAVLLLLLPLFLGLTSAGEPGQRSALVDFLAKSVNFVILFGGLGILLAKPLRAFLEARAAQLKAMMAEAEESRKQAEEKLRAIERRLQGLEEEIRKIRADGERVGENEKERILEQARREADKLRSFALHEIEMHVEAAKRELRAQAADLAIGLAEDRIGQRLTPEIHSRLIDVSIADIGKLHEKANSG
jgi:F-type H+-transporting ATPase subunit b